MDKNQKVIGSYKTEDEAIREIKQLMQEGYLKDEIMIFTNSEVAETLSNPENVDVGEPDLSGNDEDNKNDQNFWQSVKDAFKVRDRDYYNDPNYTPKDDLLYAYREDLDKGNIVVVVDNYHEDDSSDSDSTPPEETPENVQDAPQASETLGTYADFPDGGNVQGMTDGGQPLEPKADEGFQPELEDTGQQADSDELKEERLKQMDEQTLKDDDQDDLFEK